MLLELAGTLWADADFAGHVERVRAGEDPLVIAKAYGSGARRQRVVAYLLFCAARGKPFTGAYYTPAEVVDGRGSYAYRPDFLQAIREGARCLAARGAGRCLECGQVLAGGARGVRRSTRRDYCVDHVDCSLRQWREDAIRTVFGYAVTAVEARIQTLDAV